MLIQAPKLARGGTALESTVCPSDHPGVSLAPGPAPQIILGSHWLLGLPLRSSRGLTGSSLEEPAGQADVPQWLSTLWHQLLPIHELPGSVFAWFVGLSGTHPLNSLLDQMGHGGRYMCAQSTPTLCLPHKSQSL